MAGAVDGFGGAGVAVVFGGWRPGLIGAGGGGFVGEAGFGVTVAGAVPVGRVVAGCPPAAGWAVVPAV